MAQQTAFRVCNSLQITSAQPVSAVSVSTTIDRDSYRSVPRRFSLQLPAAASLPRVDSVPSILANSQLASRTF